MGLVESSCKKSKEQNPTKSEGWYREDEAGHKGDHFDIGLSAILFLFLEFAVGWWAVVLAAFGAVGFFVFIERNPGHVVAAFGTGGLFGVNAHGGWYSIFSSGAEGFWLSVFLLSVGPTCSRPWCVDVYSKDTTAPFGRVVAPRF